MHRDEALAELMRRYFTTRGPATLKDFLRWSSLTAADGRNGLEVIKSQLEREVVDGRTYWFPPTKPDAKPASPTIDLVQGYDECIMSYSESKDVLHTPKAGKPVVLNEPAFLHVILLDGQLIGRWKHVLGRREVTVVTDFSRPLRGAERRALEAAVERYGQFLGIPAALS